MINGCIADLDLAWIPVRIQDHAGNWQLLRVVLDTGFTGQLALPNRSVQRLGLTLDDEIHVTPATGQTIPVRGGPAVIMWQGRPMQVRVVQAGTHPLIGMRLLWRNHIAIDAVAGGAVAITPLGDQR